MPGEGGASVAALCAPHKVDSLRADSLTESRGRNYLSSRLWLVCPCSRDFKKLSPRELKELKTLVRREKSGNSPKRNGILKACDHLRTASLNERELMGEIENLNRKTEENGHWKI